MGNLSIEHIKKIKKYLIKNNIPEVKCPKCGLEYYAGVFPLPAKSTISIRISDACECGEKIPFGVRLI